MSDLLTGLLADLDAETAALHAVVVAAGEDGWTAPTPAPGWSVATQVAHLAWTDEAAVVAATDTAAWEAMVLAAVADPEGFVDAGAHELASAARDDVVHRWLVSGAALRNALRGCPTGQRMPWFGPPMAPASMATARFMETWAHSLDVHAALGLEPQRTDRIRHVAHLGVRTRGFAYANRGLEPPVEEIRVELTAPSGVAWAWGPEDTGQRGAVVAGSAWDFCRLVTQRVHRADTDLVVDGADGASVVTAEQWLGLAQAFAGPPGAGRAAAR